MFSILNSKKKETEKRDMTFFVGLVEGSFYKWSEPTNISFGKVVSFDGEVLKLETFPEWNAESEVLEIKLKYSGDTIKYPESKVESYLGKNYVNRYFAFYNTKEEKLEFVKTIQENIKNKLAKIEKKVEFYMKERDVCQEIIDSLK
jgi:hypothetical protein